MGVTRSQIESAAPDQAALKAASGLLKPAKWPVRTRDDAGGLIWGECQGSGANPYRVVADLADLGSKCTCPSRKFPCKHALALMWMYADEPTGFSPSATPEWVTEWLGRRRKSATAGSADLKPRGGSLAAALEQPSAAPPDPQVEARRAAATAKRAADTRAAVLEATLELDGWIADQLRTGLSGLIPELQTRCRRIAARLVDGKAQGLASRVDELPSRIVHLAASEQPDAIISELAKLAMLVRAWRAHPEDPELSRELATAESREAVLQDAAARRVSGEWEALGDRITTRRDGLVSHATWLLRRDDAPLPSAGATAEFALLLDYYPASAGRRTSAFASGDRFHGEVVFYPGAKSLRAVIADRRPAATPESAPPVVTPRNALANWRDRLAAAPWTLEAPLLLPPGRLARDGSGKAWWRSDDGLQALPLAAEPSPHHFGLQFSALTAVWTGHRLDPVAGWSDWGRVSFNG